MMIVDSVKGLDVERDADRVRDGLLCLAEALETQQRGVRLQRQGEQAQLVSAPENAR